MDSSIIYRLFFVFLIFISPVKAIEFQGKFLQGHFILGKTDPNAKILVGKKEVKVSKDGFFVFGIDRDQKYDLTFTKIINGKKSITTKKVLKRKYNIQRIDGLAESKVTPPESVYKRIKKENNAIGEARAINSDLQFFKEKFIMPVEGIISGVYGSQRILNGKPRWPHYGIDIAAKQGTMIKSSGSGVVTMAEEDLKERGWEPNPLRILKSDIPIHMEADKDFVDLNLKLAYNKEKVEFLEAVVKTLNLRSYQINNAINWEKFKVGN